MHSVRLHEVISKSMCTHVHQNHQMCICYTRTLISAHNVSPSKTSVYVYLLSCIILTKSFKVVAIVTVYISIYLAQYNSDRDKTLIMEYILSSNTILIEYFFKLQKHILHCITYINTDNRNLYLTSLLCLNMVQYRTYIEHTEDPQVIWQ